MLFEQALERLPAERAPFLETACTDDPTLRAEVWALLQAHEEVRTGKHDLLSMPVGRYAVDLVAAAFEARDVPPHTAMAGSQIGPYHLEHELGRGGMGTVYLATRIDVGKPVALKLIRGELAPPERRQRFLDEQRILARLQHPHIAALLDAGLTVDGKPFFAMEYVEGEPIDHYCDGRRLTVEARLCLFETVCRAVQHAHAHFIVHCDLKPSNILVAEDEAGQAQVKLLDFGIAKVLSGTADVEAASLTEPGAGLMTPAYAAPEQARGEAVTAATDVYSLGVILYELLTGNRPHHADYQGPAVQHDAPQQALKPPSVAVTEPGLTTQERAGSRSTTARQLSRRLRGDLDDICLKALAQDPAQRYASAEALRDDVHRHLAALPVTARPQTAGYRTGRFVRRHRTATAAVLVIVLLVLGYALTVTVQAQRITAERDRTTQALAQAETVTDFLMGLFEASDPSTSPGIEVTARELLARGVAHVETLGEEPLVQARLLDVVGRVYSALGEYEQAQAQLEHALTLHRAEQGENHLDVAVTLQRLGLVMVYRGDYDEAESLYRQALTIQRELFQRELSGDEAARLVLAGSLQGLAHVMMYRGDYDEAESLYRQALAMRRELLGDEHAHPDVAATLSNLAITMLRKGAYDEAETLFREVLVMDRELSGDEHPDVAATLMNLANTLMPQEAYDEAETLYRESLAMSRKLLGIDHPQVAQVLINLAIVRSRQGAYDEAETLYREALAVSRQRLGAEHPQVAQLLMNLANTMRWKGEYEEAEALYRESLAMSRKRLGAEHPVVAMTLNNLGDLMSQQGVLDEAETLYREALAMRQRLLGPTHPHVAVSQSNLAGVLRRRGAHAEAEQLLLKALPLLQERLGAAHEDTRLACERLTRLYADQERPSPPALCDATTSPAAPSTD